MSPRVPREWVRNPSDELAIGRGHWFDPAAGLLVCDFVEGFCRQSVGRWAGQPLTLVDWQRDLVMRLYGWKQASGLRRFRRCYVEIGKKNGKSTLVSSLSLYHLVADGENTPQIYLNACDRNQASIVYDEAARMVRSSPDLDRRVRVVDSRKRIVHDEGNGVIIANSADAPNKDGLNPSFIVFDELHRQADTTLWDVFEYACGAREQPLTLSITTAGEDESGVWWEQRDYSERVNRGEIPDVTHLGIVYRANPDDEIGSPSTWRKANPSLGVTLSEGDFVRELAEVKETPRKLAGFLRLRLNIVSNADVTFLAPEAWAACSDPPRPLESLRGEPCWAGMDLSTTTDLTAVCLLFGTEDSGLDCHWKLYMPEESVREAERRDKVPYRYWVDCGYITTTPGNVVDYEFVRRDVNAFAAGHDLRKLLTDPYNATNLGLSLQSDGINLDFLRQGFLSLSAPTKELERLVLGRKIRHGGHPVLKWMASNAVAETDAAGNVKLSKKRSTKRIDGFSALVDGLAAWSADNDGTSVYSTRGILVL